jgi:hypothetical protein
MSPGTSVNRYDNHQGMWMHYDREQVLGWLNMTWTDESGTTRCTNCGHTEFKVGRLLVLPWAQSVSDEQLSDGAFFAVPVTCERCAVIRFVSPVIAGAIGP